MAEQLICNQQVVGSTPITSSIDMGEFPSGQRGQTVNLLSLTSLVRIQLPPPNKKHTLAVCFLFGERGALRPGTCSPNLSTVVFRGKCAGSHLHRKASKACSLTYLQAYGIIQQNALTKEYTIMDGIATLIIGVLCIFIGISNCNGNISTLHSYHRKRVSEENRLPFGKTVGTGMITVGSSLVASGALSFIAEALRNSICSVIGNVTLAVGLVVGFGICFYAMIKYNKGIF